MLKKIILAIALNFLLITAFAQNDSMPPAWQAKTFCLMNGYFSLTSEALKENFFDSLATVYKYCDCVIPLSLKKFQKNQAQIRACGGDSASDECLAKKPLESVEDKQQWQACQPLMDKYKKITDVD